MQEDLPSVGEGYAYEAPSIAVGLRTAIAVSGLALFYTFLDLYASDAWGTPVPAIWVLVYVAAGLVVAATDPGRLVTLARSPLFHWTLAFFCIVTLWGMFSKDVPALMTEIVNRYRTVALLIAFGIFFQERRVRRAAFIALAGCLVLACALNVLEAFNVVHFIEDPTREPGRSGGMYVNANTSGCYIVFGVAVCVAGIPRAFRLPIVFIGAVGVALTFSRGAVLAYGVVVVALAAMRIIKVGKLVGISLVAVAALAYFSADVAGSLESAGVLNSNTWMRVRGESTESGSERVELALRAWNMFAHSPLLGSGFGSTIDWDAPVHPHNQYLLLATDYGILGLFLFPALGAALVACTRTAIPLALSLLVSGMFSHNLLTERAMIVLLALAAAGPALLEEEPEPEREAMPS